jgi:collagenase-like PrtC family protease
MPSEWKSRDLGTRPELLSPAGDRESLLAAVKNGADAVYLGIREFNARIYARNFSLQELERAIGYCHSNGVRVYLTLNTMVKNHEVGRFFDVLSRAYTLEVDGVIIQHISFLEIIKNNFPGLKVFLSTQSAIGNAGSASILKSADRIILPRELTLGEIERVIDSGIKTEVFVHGALCFSYSGLCLFSSFVSSRSGNRGSCAQLCRQRYNDSYPLSVKELCLVRRIPELIRAGVNGFKIEGRMRSPLYVAVATRLYRKAIDSCLNDEFVVPQKEMAEIEVVFNREFTEGFIGDETNLTSPDKPMNRGAFLGEIRGNEVVVQRPVAIGDGIGIWCRNQVSGGVIKELSVGGAKVTSAAAGKRVNLGIETEEGARVYLTSSPRISIEPDFTIHKPPISLSKREKIKAVLPRIVPQKAPPLKLLAKVYSIEEAREASQAGADMVFYNIFAPDFPKNEDWTGEALLGAYLPRIMSDSELYKAFDLLQDKRPAVILTGNIGFLSRRAEFKVPVYLDYSLNTFNDLDLLFLQAFKAIPLISPELSLNEMVALKNKDAVIFCHGDIVLVNTKIDPGAEELVDEKGSVFPVRKENSYWQILNSRPFGLFNDIHRLLATGFTQFYIDKQNKSADFVRLYRKVLKHKVASRRIRRGYTSGHLYQPIL